MVKTTEERLARIEQILESQHEFQSEQIRLLSIMVQDLDKRVKELELWRAETKGGWAVLSALGVGSSAATLIMAKITGLIGG